MWYQFHEHERCKNEGVSKGLHQGYKMLLRPGNKWQYQNPSNKAMIGHYMMLEI